MAYENPKWLREAVAGKVRGRRSLGAQKTDYANFIRLFNFKAAKFDESVPKMLPDSKVITDIVCKIYSNHTEQETAERDEVEIKGQKSASSASTRNYQLTLGNESTKQFSVGGNAGLSADFFNMGGAGVGINAQATTSNTKREENLYNEGTQKSLQKEYSITGTVKIPPMTKLTVTIQTATVTYELSNILVKITAPAYSSLRVKMTRSCCCQSQYCFITTEEFMRTLCDPTTIKREEGSVIGYVSSVITYLGEQTIVDKEMESLREQASASMIKA